MVNQKDDRGLIKRRFLGQCTHIKKDGNRCRAIANKETGLCSIHAGLVPRVEGQIDPTKSLVHTKIYLSRVMKEVKAGKIAPQVANAINSIASNLIKIHEIEEIQRYLDQHRADVNKQHLNKEGLPSDYVIQDE